MRHASTKDYSKVIRDWAKKRNIEPLRTKNMAVVRSTYPVTIKVVLYWLLLILQTRFDGLTVRFGYPYLYQHQSNCEHIVVFPNAWLLGNSDPLNTKNYPYISSFAPDILSMSSACCARKNLQSGFITISIAYHMSAHSFTINAS